MEKIINNQSFDSGIRFKGGKDAGPASKQTASENKATNETLGKILREIKNVKGQQDKMREEICGRQNNLESELNRIRVAIEEAAKQEDDRNRSGTEKNRMVQHPRMRSHRSQSAHAPILFETRMEGVTIENLEIDTSIQRCDNGGRLVYIDEIGTYDYASWEDMVEFYQSKNWTFQEMKVWTEERQKAIEDWKIKEKEGLIALRKAEKEAEMKKKKQEGIIQNEGEKKSAEKEHKGLERSSWADQVEEQSEEMELDSWSGITTREGVEVDRPKMYKGKGKATRTPTPPPQNFDFKKARNRDDDSSDIEVVYPAHNFDPSRVITERSGSTKKPQIASKIVTPVTLASILLGIEGKS